MRNIIIILVASALISCVGIPAEILKSKSAEYKFPILPSTESTIVYLISPVAYQEPSAHQQVKVNGINSKLYFGSYSSITLAEDATIQYRFNHNSNLVDAGQWNQLKVAANKNELFYVLKNGLFTQVSKEQAVAQIVTIEYRYCEYKPKPCEPMVYNAI
ncbi:hypothetical protein P4S60_09440 [Pseudoalteromonas sp. Hal040]|uniref:hypothetical protein n=1 Tax=unclassified Pseudoalteromonas TaxID=194690 RepID=UPI00301BF654